MKTLITMRRRTKLSTRTSFGKRVGILLLNATWLLACSPWSAETQQALKLAGENRVELEKVLHHYKELHPDPLKLRAAEFLISNMDVHFSYSSKTWDEFQVELADLYAREDSKAVLKQSLERLYDKYAFGLAGDLTYISDLKTVSSDFLIHNIEAAFESWRSPYADHLSFEDFCEYLLPYRVGTEPLSDWRKAFNEHFIPLLHQRLPEGEDVVSAEDYCNLIKTDPHANLSLIGGRLPDYSAQLLSVMRMGNCKHYSAQALLAARTLGIPVSIDFTPQWATRSMGHEWNALIQRDGKPLNFGIGDGCELGEHIEFIPDRVPPKVYRQTFSKQKESLAVLAKGEAIPPSLASPCMKDVTHEYYDCADVSVTFDVKAPGETKFAYLAVFDNANWVPVCWARTDDNTALFENLNKDILYMPGYYNEDGFMPAALPFILDDSGNIRRVKPNPERTQTLVLSRKYQNGLVDGNCKEMLGGRFQAANRPDFSDAFDLAEIKEKPEASYQIVDLDAVGAYRYFRYLARPNSLGTIAELEVHYEGDKLRGKIIGTEQTIPNFAPEHAFDGDPLTNFIKWESEEVWIGLEFERPSQIDKIVYLPGNDDNCIRDGELYELFYWNNQWISLGKQKGSSETYKLSYDEVPAGGLYLLRNRTKGTEERIFTYENDRQRWW